MTKSSTNKSAALISASTLALAAVVALEVTGLQALSNGNARWSAAAAADGDTIYTQGDRIASVEIHVVAQN
jgi:hypothetical protein